jgi:AAA+ ATPase superfamily predicted ATPase
MIIKPYPNVISSTYRNPIFVGREQILREIYSTVINRQQNAIILLGQPRIGKTSILRELEFRLPNIGNFIPIFFDLLGKTHQSLEEILRGLAEEILQGLAYEISGHIPDLSQQPAMYFYKILLPNLLKKEKTSLVLLLDEFNALDNEKLIGFKFISYLRDLLVLNPKKLNFVFILGKDINDLTPSTSNLLQNIPIQNISLLNQKRYFRLNFLTMSFIFDMVKHSLI